MRSLGVFVALFMFAFPPLVGASPAVAGSAPTASATGEQQDWLDEMLAKPGDRWGAFAMGIAFKYGWSNGLPSESEARRAAEADCAESGGEDCRVEKTFLNQCGALALGTENYGMQLRPAGSRRPEELRRAALKLCGAGCTVVREGC